MFPKCSLRVSRDCTNLRSGLKAAWEFHGWPCEKTSTPEWLRHPPKRIGCPKGLQFKYTWVCLFLRSGPSFEWFKRGGQKENQHFWGPQSQGAGLYEVCHSEFESIELSMRGSLRKWQGSCTLNHLGVGFNLRVWEEKDVEDQQNSHFTHRNLRGNGQDSQ